MKTFLKILTGIVALLILTVVIGYFAGKHYLESGQTKVIKNVPFLNNSELHFDEVELNIFENFPKADFGLRNVHLYNTSDSLDVSELIQIDSLVGFVNLQDWKKREIELNKISLHHASFHAVKDMAGHSNFGNLLSSEKDKKKTKGNGWLNFTTNPQSEIEMDSVAIHLIDSTKQKNLNGTIRQLSAKLDFREDTSIQVNTRIYSDHLTFNWFKGPYLEKSNIETSFTANITNGNILIDTTDVFINGEPFQIGASIYPSQPDKPTILAIQKEETDFAATRQLLPYHIQKQLSEYNVVKTFPTDTKIIFTSSSNPRVEIDFELTDNETKVKKYRFTKTDLEGRFVNRLYDDERSLTEGKKNLRVIINSFQGMYDEFALRSDTGLVTYTPEKQGRLHFNGVIDGPASGLSEYFQDEPFRFVEGSLTIQANVNGPLYDAQGILEETDADLEFRDLRIFYRPSNVSFPFERLDVEKTGNEAEFLLKGQTIKTNHDFTIQGDIQQFNDIFKKIENKQTESRFNITAGILSWQDFMNMFGTNGYLSNESPSDNNQKNEGKTATMKKVISALQNKFQPELDIRLDTLAYKNGLYLYDFISRLEFEDEHTLVLSRTNFATDNGSVDINGKLDISRPTTTSFTFDVDANHLNLEQLLPKANYFNVNILRNVPKLPEDLSLQVNTSGVLDDLQGIMPSAAEGTIQFKSEKDEVFEGTVDFTGISTEENGTDTPLIHTDVNLVGEPKAVNNLFNTSKYLFEEGRFDLAMNYRGNLESVEEVLQKATVQLDIEDTNIVDTTSRVSIPIDYFNTHIENDDATIDLKVHTDSIHQIMVDGGVENISQFIYHNKLNNHEVFASIYSPTIDWQEFQTIFQSRSTDTASQKQQIAFKQTVLNALRNFNPDLDVTIDDFIFSDELKVENITSGLHMQDSSTLVLEETGFNYMDGEIGLNGTIELDKEDLLPFYTQITTRKLNAGRLLEGLDYLNIDGLKNTEELEGIVNLNGELQGTYGENGVGFIREDMEGTVSVELLEAHMKEMKIIDSIAKKFWMRDRFEDLKFAPIRTTVQIDGEQFSFPMTEIQSNAAHVFIESSTNEYGEPSYWMTVPFQTVFQSAKDSIPPLTGSAAGRNKFFLEFTTDEDGEPTTRFHLSKRKFFRQHGIEDKFKEYKRQMREARRKR